MLVSVKNYPALNTEPGDCMHLPSNLMSSIDSFFLLLYMLSQAAKRVKAFVKVLLMPSAVRTKVG